MNAPAHRIAKQRFGKSLPALSLLARNTTLILVKNHFISNGPSSLDPVIIEVAGIHFKPTKKLPEARSVPITTTHTLHVLYNNTDLPMNDY
jgi:hypothetical protein